MVPTKPPYAAFLDHLVLTAANRTRGVVRRHGQTGTTRTRTARAGCRRCGLAHPTTGTTCRARSSRAAHGGKRMSRPSRPRGRRSAAFAATGTVVLAALLAGVGAGPAVASSHREAPLIAADPAVDNTDVYAFVSPDQPDTVTFVANWFGLQEPNGGPTFYP